MTKRTNRTTTVTRKKLKVMGDLTDAQKFNILKMYTEGKGYADISSKFNVDKQKVCRWTGDFIKAVERQKELGYLLKGQPKSKDYGAPVTANKALTENFLSLLSDDDDPMVNEAEHIYISSWVQFGNSGRALTDAKLDIGINEVGIRANKQLKQARGQYLRRRPKVKMAIEKEEAIMLEEMASSKEFLQKTLIQTVRELQEDVGDNGSNRNNLLKSIELLGKTIPGSFTETVRTEEVSPKDTLTLLMKKVQESKVEGDASIDKVTYHAE